MMRWASCQVARSVRSATKLQQCMLSQPVRLMSSGAASTGKSSDILDSLMGGASADKAQGQSPDEEQRMKDVDAIFESLFGRSRKKTDLGSLKYFRLYPKEARQWIEDAKTTPGVFDRFGNWVPEKTSNVYRKDQPAPTRFATDGLPFRKDLPKDLEGHYRFGVREEEVAAVPPKVKELLSFRWASQPEITAFRARKAAEKFQKHSMDVGSTAVQVARLTVRIRGLTEHMTANHKDKRTKRALITLVSQRAKMMKYLKRTNIEQYYDVLTELNLRDSVR